jgi:CcmD family protein
MSLLLAVAPELPLGKAGKFVAGAYIVVFAVILIYVAIMAVRAQRLERELSQLRRDVEAARAGADGDHRVAGAAEHDPERVA